MLNIDAQTMNADWTKQSWDLPCETLHELRVYLAETNTTVEHFKTLPVYILNVEKLPWLADL